MQKSKESLKKLKAIEKFNLVYNGSELNENPLTESESFAFQSSCIINYGYRPELVKVCEKSIEPRFFETLSAVTNSHQEVFQNDYLHIIPQEEECYQEIKFRIYHSAGYCWDVSREYTCEPDEIADFEDVDADGYTYCFLETWEGFKNTGIKYVFHLVENITNTWLDSKWSLENLI